MSLICILAVKVCSVGYGETGTPNHSLGVSLAVRQGHSRASVAPEQKELTLKAAFAMRDT